MSPQSGGRTPHLPASHQQENTQTTEISLDDPVPLTDQENGDDVEMGRISTTSPTAATSPDPRLPTHLQNLPEEQQQALRRRMERELALDEARNAHPHRRIERNAKQLYSAAIGTTIFLLLILIKIQTSIQLSWMLVFLPLITQYACLSLLACLDVYDSYKLWRLHRLGTPADGFTAMKQLVAKSHESTWNFACLVTIPLLALHLEEPSSSSLYVVFAAVWGYGCISVLLAFTFVARGWITGFAHESAGSVFGSILAWSFALLVRVLPVLLAVQKIEGAGYSWHVAFIPLWVPISLLGMFGTTACCIVPMVLVTHDTAGRTLATIICIASCFMIIPAICTLVFLVLLAEYLEDAEEDEKPANSLISVLMPLFVMYVLLAILTPVLVRIVRATHNFMDAVQQTANAHAPDDADAGKRPGRRRKFTTPQHFIRQSSHLFQRHEGMVPVEETNELIDSSSAASSPRETSIADSNDIESHPESTEAGKHMGTALDVASKGELSSSPRKSTVSSGGDSMCYVCVERPKNSVLQPCGHGGMCFECAVDLAQTRTSTSDAPPKCPLCRADVKEVFELDHVSGSSAYFVATTSWIVGSLTGFVDRGSPRGLFSVEAPN